jgi:hypothetical protein
MGAVAPQDPPGHRTPEMGRSRIHPGPVVEVPVRGALVGVEGRVGVLVDVLVCVF